MEQSIFDLISVGGYKQAQTKLSKELKKAPKSDELLSLQAYLCYEQGLDEEALVTAREVAKMEPTDPTALFILQLIYDGIGTEEDKIGQVFETASRKAPNDKRILSIWNNAGIDDSDYKTLLKSSMIRLKWVPGRRSTLRVVFNIWLAYPVSSEAEKKIYISLALRYLETIKPYQTPYEAYLEALVLGLSDKKKLIDHVKQCREKWPDDLEFIVLYLETVKAEQEWQAVFDECIKVLSHLDNWVHWQNLIKAGLELGLIERISETIANYKVGRNSLLAAVDLWSQLGESKKLEVSIEAYLSKYGHKRCAYEDLKNYITTFNFIDREIENMDDLIYQVNVEKLRAFANNGVVKDINHAINLYQKSKFLLNGKDPKDYHPGDDFLLLASIELIKTQDLENIIKAIVLLEYACQRDRHQFYVRLWLIRLYNFFGAYTRAKGHFDSLSIKSLQIESLSHMVTTRVSSLYPNVKSIGMFDDIYFQHRSSMEELVEKCYEKGAYSELKSFYDLNRKLKNSLTKAVLDAEINKINTIRGAQGHSIRRITNRTDRLEDNRDFHTMFTINDDVKLGGPVPGNNWVRVQFFKTKIMRLLLKEDTCIEFDTNDSDLTEVEKWAFNVLKLLFSSSQKKIQAKGYAEVREALASFSVSAEPGWYWLHYAFTVMELHQIIKGYATKLKGARQHVKFNLPELEKLVQATITLKNKIRADAEILKSSRQQRIDKFSEDVGTWADSLGIETEHVTYVIEGIEASYSEALVILRSL